MKIDLDKITIDIDHGYYDGEESISLCYNGEEIENISWETTVKALIEMVERYLREKK